MQFGVVAAVVVVVVVWNAGFLNKAVKGKRVLRRRLAWEAIGHFHHGVILLQLPESFWFSFSHAN